MSWEFPSWAESYVAAFTQPWVLIAMGGGSLLLFILGILGVPWFVSRLPVDYFSRGERELLGIASTRHPALRAILRVARNVLGALLFFLGVVMLVLPGQGLAAILVSLFLLDFPGKNRSLRYVIHLPVIFRGVNAIRARAGKAPLIHARRADSGEKKPDDVH